MFAAIYPTIVASSGTIMYHLRPYGRARSGGLRGRKAGEIAHA